MPRHLDPADHIIVSDEGSPLTHRSKLKFTGDGVTVADNSGDESTDVDMPGGGGGLTPSLVGWRYWSKSGLSVSTASSADTDLGSLDSNGGSQTWFDSGASSLSSGLIKFAEQGLFAITHNFYFTIVAGSPADNDLFGIRAQVFVGATLRYEVPRSVKVAKYNGTNSNLNGSITLTDMFEVGGSVQFKIVKPAAGMTTRSAFVDTWISRVA